MLQSVGLQRVGHDLGTKQQQQLEEMAENKNKGHFCSSAFNKYLLGMSYASGTAQGTRLSGGSWEAIIN